jgi:hypothetical protein
MRSLWTGSLLAPRDFLRRPPSVGTCPPVMTYKANPGRTRPFHFSLVRRQEKAPTGPGLQGNDQQSPARRHPGGSENLRCALSALPSSRFRLIYGSREGAYSRNTSPLQRVHHPSRSNVAEPVLYCAGNGLGSVARGTLPLALFGSSRYPTLMGRLALPILMSMALSPFLALSGQRCDLNSRAYCVPRSRKRVARRVAVDLVQATADGG